MQPLASISGLATGIDFQSLVGQIMEIESQRLDYLRVQVSDDQAKKAAWEEVRGLLTTLDDATGKLSDGSGLDVFSTSLFGLNTDVLEVTADGFASPGRHTVRVLQKAQREVLGSASFSSRSLALGQTGQFVIQGSVIDVAAEDSLQGIAGKINALNFGPDAIGVSADVVGSQGAYRLILSATETGADGIGLLDLSGILGTLGVLDATTEIKNRTSGGFQSDGFGDATTAVGTLLGFAGAAPNGTVTLGEGANAFAVTLNLGLLSLEGVRDAINAAAATAGAATFAEIVIDTSGGTAVQRLALTGEAAATDDGAVLQALGLLSGGRGAVSQVVQGDVLTTDAGGTLATAATALTSLFNGGSNAGVTAGDTITFQGTGHDGTAFSFTHTIQGGDTIQTILTRLEGVEGFNGSATAEVDAEGRITFTSTVGGASRLSLSGFAGNESGAILDLGAFRVTTGGRNREISRGTDALVEIDGALVTSSTNAISGVVSGVTFNVLGADPGNDIEVVIERDFASVVESVTAFVDAFNALAAFVSNGVGVIGDNRPPLAGDMLLRGMRDQISFALQASLPAGAAGTVSRLGEIGIEITRDGTLSLDTARLEETLRADPEGVRRLFTAYGVGSTSALTYLGAGTATPPGTYDVAVTQLGSYASATSIGFGGVYVDDGSADTLTITDLASSTAYQVALTNGMTLLQIIDAVNAELAVTQTQEVTSERTMYSDAGASVLANSSTTLADLYHGAGQSSGFTAGTQITFSGSRPDGTAVLEAFDVTDPNTQTLGQLRSAMESAFGSGVSVSIVAGRLVVRDLSAGESQLSVSVGSDVPGNAAPFGQMLVTSQGRGGSSIVAEAGGTELRIRDSSYGSAQGFSIAFTAGGASGVGSLGLSTGSFSGTDVVGTIGGEAATGVGNILTAAAGTTAAGLAVKISGSTTGALGTVTYGTGMMTNVSNILGGLLRSGDGTIDSIVKGLSESVDRVEDRLFDREMALESRRARLTAQFVALEEAMARAQATQEWLTAQLGTLGSNS